MSLFGVGGIDYVQGGGGSGMVYCNRVKNLYEAFLEKSPDFEVYSSSAKYYFDYLSSHQADFDYVPFCNEIEIPDSLIDEWGFKGVVTTDWEVPCDQTYCILAGNDMRMPYGDPAVLKESLENGRLTHGQLELCVKRILELFLKFE